MVPDRLAFGFDRVAERRQWHISCKYKGEAARLQTVKTIKSNNLKI